jgi:hypothetical protein
LIVKRGLGEKRQSDKTGESHDPDPSDLDQQKENHLTCCSKSGGRAISTLHKTVLEAMGITEIIQLEKEYADFFATKTELTTLIYSYQVSPDYYIYEMKLPPAAERVITFLRLSFSS